jgi:hypothetical protein
MLSGCYASHSKSAFRMRIMLDYVALDTGLCSLKAIATSGASTGPDRLGEEPMRLAIRWAGVICALLIAWWAYRTFGQRLDLPTDRDRFIYAVATQFREPGLCQKISRHAEGSGGGTLGGLPGYNVSYLQSNCYWNLAAVLHDPSLCDKVRPISKGFLDGSKYNPAECRANRASGIGVVDQHTIVAMMRKLGYVDQEIRDFRHGGEVGNAVYDAYSQLRKDGLFAERIKAAPTFDEPLRPDGIRPANELEYVYQMFAVDTNDSTFCGKISPNAQAERLNHTTFMLRVGCNRSIALNSRNIAACEKLPARGNLPPGVSDAESRESCIFFLGRIRPDIDTHVRYGPAFPPTFLSFQKALQELGYDLTFPVTAGDYEFYLQRLADTRQPLMAAPRAEFLRRVAAME